MNFIWFEYLYLIHLVTSKHLQSIWVWSCLIQKVICLWFCLFVCLFTSGGRGEDSSVIITLPECSAFSDIPEEALAKVFTYLTLIPRCVLLRSSLPQFLPLPSLQCTKCLSLIFWAQLAFTAPHPAVSVVLLMPSMPKPRSPQESVGNLELHQVLCHCREVQMMKK